MRCSPQVHGVVYDCLTEVEAAFESAANKFHFKYLHLNNKKYSNMLLRSDGLTLKLDFLICSLNEIGSMSHLRSERILNKYLGKNNVTRESCGSYEAMSVLMQKTIHLISNNRLICAPSNADTMNIENYQMDIFFTQSKCL
jgi:histidine ammonia-lyase